MAIKYLLLRMSLAAFFLLGYALITFRDTILVTGLQPLNRWRNRRADDA